LERVVPLKGDRGSLEGVKNSLKAPLLSTREGQRNGVKWGELCSELRTKSQSSGLTPSSFSFPKKKGFEVSEYNEKFLS